MFCFIISTRELTPLHGMINYWKLDEMGLIAYNDLRNVQNYHYDARLLFDMGPYFSNCVIILAMAFERFILVCFTSSADRILSRQRRILLYSLVCASIIAAFAILAIDLYDKFFFNRYFQIPILQVGYLK